MDEKTQHFINRAVAKHGDKYDYTQVVYKNTHTKVTIICKDHGAFDIRPNDHLRGFGCTVCSGKRPPLTHDQVIQRIRSIHGDKYDCSNVVFQTINHDITLICPEHGDFTIKPKSIFLQQAGCNKCAYHMRGNSRRKSIDRFISEATAIHGSRYDYSHITEYKNNKTNLPIICPTHGVFLQTATSHITQKSGCPLCNTGNGKGGYTHAFFDHNPDKKSLPGVLYAAYFTNGKEQFIKIGITAKTTGHRFNRSEYKGMTIEVLHECYMPLYDAFCIEQDVIAKLKDHRFYSNTAFSGHTECFRNTPDVITEIQNIFINKD